MTSVEVLDKPDDVAGFKRASEETEARIQTLENTFMHTHTPSSSAYFLPPSLFRNCIRARIPDGGSDGNPRQEAKAGGLAGRPRG
jgi:hypothetical protein